MKLCHVDRTAYEVQLCTYVRRGLLLYGSWHIIFYKQIPSFWNPNFLHLFNKQDALVLCRIFQKSGSGPKNGEQYGAPYLEEEWENDELATVPKNDVCAMELPVCDDVYLDGNDLEQVGHYVVIVFISL